MPARSAGLLVYRRTRGALEVLLAHPGGPYYRNKDAGAWSIPKGEIESDEDALRAAIREFGEETSFEPGGPFHALAAIRQKSGKIVLAWACEADLDVTAERHEPEALAVVGEVARRDDQRPRRDEGVQRRCHRVDRSRFDAGAEEQRDDPDVVRQ